MDYFTADPHFGHANVIGFCNRPFDSVQEMDAAILSTWNATLKPGDQLYILGDFNGQRVKAAEIEHYANRIHLHRGNIHLVLGNHDDEKECRKVFSRVSHMHTFGHGRKDRHNIVLCHYSMRTWNGLRKDTAWHLYGHWHGTGPACPFGRSFDVGVDASPHGAPFGRLWSYDTVAMHISFLTQAAPVQFTPTDNVRY